jgi:hypothetical protein
MSMEELFETHRSPPFRLVNSETVPLTKELVAEMRALKPSPTERELSPKRVQFLRGGAIAEFW